MKKKDIWCDENIMHHLKFSMKFFSYNVIGSAQIKSICIRELVGSYPARPIRCLSQMYSIKRRKMQWNDEGEVEKILFCILSCDIYILVHYRVSDLWIAGACEYYSNMSHHTTNNWTEIDLCHMDWIYRVERKGKSIS